MWLNIGDIKFEKNCFRGESPCFENAEAKLRLKFVEH